MTSLAQADAEVAAAAAAQEAADVAYRDGLLQVDDAGLQRLDAARTDARLRVDRAKAVRDALGEKQAVAEVREAETRKRAAYDAAVSQADEAREILSTLYPAAASDIAKIIATVASAEAAVAAVNADLPEGAPKLLPVEASVRNVGRERALVSERTVHLWCREGERMPGNLDQSRVETDPAGHGFVRWSTSQIEYVVQRKFTERMYEEADRLFVSDLAETVSLPGLTARDAPHWKPLSQGQKPEWVLDAAERLAIQGAAAARRDPNPTIKTELELMDVFDPSESARPGPDPLAAAQERGERGGRALNGSTGER
ncbi:hypothetical protein NS228_06285 [Methylobacterium indicum]|nr:hypothetical protein NS229_14545 [Methylobacterium indicum]KTS41565.1 hypothetical protein NS228_06285 [Methylobacterium indicum]KTS45180.1 hypothetical protein NS230_24275 [Methylobacterium indicum]